MLLNVPKTVINLMNCIIFKYEELVSSITIYPTTKGNNDNPIFWIEVTTPNPVP